VLNRALAAPVFLLAACTVPARESPPAPREDPPPARPAAEAPAAAIVASDPAAAAHAEASSPTRTLFLANCAQCHGEKGDGEGVTQLDRKARSFLDGGFSYGNTKDAILRSITHGIPGTPMPAFEKALTEAQRVELAEYVIAFGPDQIVVDPSESEMIVTDRPVIVRGKLPAIVEGAQEWPRGLAIGTPEGLTFEYRTDDVQLVGVRAGRFLNRSDWGERGGTALEMLGQPVWTNPTVEGLTTLSLGSIRDDLPVGGRRVRARLTSTSSRDGRASVEYELSTEAGSDPVVRATEECHAFYCSIGSGFVVRTELRALRPGVSVWTSQLTNDTRFLGIRGGSVCVLPGTKPALVIARSPETLMIGAGAQVAFPLDPDRAIVLERFVLLDLLEPADLELGSRTLDRLMAEFNR